MSIFTPVNQIRLTNVAVCRLRKGGKRFELACYPNKVTAWRSGVERDLGEVLQTDTVFSNVSKGAAAKKNDLVKAFGTDDTSKICLEILAKGEMQVSGTERQRDLSALFSEIATIVAGRCVDPGTGRPYTVGVIEKALKNIHFSASSSRSAKQQALEAIGKLRAVMPIERAQMLIVVRLPKAAAKNAKDTVANLAAEVVSEEWVGGDLELECLVDPGRYRDIDEAVRDVSRGKGSTEVVQLKVVAPQQQQQQQQQAQQPQQQKQESGQEVVDEGGNKGNNDEGDVDGGGDDRGDSQDGREANDDDDVDGNGQGNGSKRKNKKKGKKAVDTSVEVPGTSRSRRGNKTGAMDLPGHFSDDSDEDFARGKKGKKKGKKGRR